MQTYYKGYISSSDISNEIKHIMETNGISCREMTEEINYGVLTTNEIFSLRKYIINMLPIIKLGYRDIKSTEPNIIKILDKLMDNITTKFKDKYIEIIYEKFEDENGYTYGKELLTGLIFPIYDNKTKVREYMLHATESWISAIWYCINLKIKYKILLPTMDKCECIITETEVADNNEVLTYLKQFEKGLTRKIKEKRFKDLIMILYNKNVYNTEIIPKQKRKLNKEKQNTETAMMENIEYLLKKLKSINLDKYNEYKEQYDNIIDNDNFSYRDLAYLEGSIEYYLTFGKSDGNNITEYLEDLKKTYLEKTLNNQDIPNLLSIKEIDRLEALFLKVKDKYPLGIQRKVLKDLSFIYLISVYNSIDTIKYEEFEDSYFIDNLKTIILLIESLLDLGIIKNNIAIDLNDDITLENILNIIKKIAFITKPKEEVNKLIKRI